MPRGGITIETFLEHLEGKNLPFASLLERQLFDGKYWQNKRRNEAF